MARRAKLALPRRTLRPLVQPYDSGTCAPTSIAMVAGVTLDEAVAAAGMLHASDGMDSRWVIHALKQLGIRHGKWISTYHGTRRDVPDFCLACMEATRTQWAHMVAILDGFVYDPSIGWPMPIRAYEDFILERAYSLKYPAFWESFLPILSQPPA